MNKVKKSRATSTTMGIDPWSSGYYLQEREPAITETDLDEELPDLDPHYLDERFKHGKKLTVFGSERAGLFYNHSDRIISTEATEAADRSGAKRKTARWFQEYLTAFHGEPVKLEHILVGVNGMSGYAYHAYGYTLLSEKNPKRSAKKV